MIRKEQDGVSWLEFELFGDLPFVKHAMFLRHGGVSPAPFDSLNFSSFAGDSKDNVQRNFDKAKRILGLEILVYSHLCHGKSIIEYHPSHLVDPQVCDGVATSQKDIGLLMTHADCQVALFVDPVHRAIANVHAGWRGNVANIYHETVAFMKKAYGTSPKDLLVGVSPSLGPDDAEFINYREELPESFWKFQTKPNFFNLWEVAHSQLTEAGIASHHIEIAGISTLSSPGDFFSYRRQKISGRHGTVIALV